MGRTRLNTGITALLILMLATSCQKVINVKLNNQTGRLVIEGNLTNIPGSQTVKLSQNVDFTNTNTYPPVNGATVSVTDQNGLTYAFTGTSGGIYTAGMIKGQRGVTYTLNVNVNGQAYTGKSTMPAQVKLDSLSVELDDYSSDGRKQVIVNYFDPPGVPNYYRFVLYVNGVQVKQVFPYSDEFTDGKVVGLILQQDDIHIYKGNVVSVEMQCIDQNLYNYWYALRQISGSDFSGVTPADPPSNMSNNALGYFSAHTTQTKTLTVP